MPHINRFGEPPAHGTKWTVVVDSPRTARQLTLFDTRDEAHAEIIRLIRELCDDGLALLVISSELDEIVTYSDRVVVLRDRTHVDELQGEAIDVSNILAAIAADGGTAMHETAP